MEMTSRTYWSFFAIALFSAHCSASISRFVCPDFLSYTGEEVAIRETALFGAKSSEWTSVQNSISTGGYHFHGRLLSKFNATQAQTVVNFLKEKKFRVSVEAGGSMCLGLSKAHATQNLKSFEPYFQAGGTIDYYQLESVFSHSLGDCKNFSVVDSVKATVEYAQALFMFLLLNLSFGTKKVIKERLPNVKFGLIDAVPHFPVGPWPVNPINKPKYGHMDDLLDVLSKLKTAMHDANLAFESYWADCPYEYSIAGGILGYPDGKGYKKLQYLTDHVKAMGLRMGKIFNSQVGGQTSDEMFYNHTMQDFANFYKQVNETLGDFDVVVESWYDHPRNVVPEDVAYNFMYTAREVFKQIQ